MYWNSMNSIRRLKILTEKHSPVTNVLLVMFMQPIIRCLERIEIEMPWTAHDGNEIIDNCEQCIFGTIYFCHCCTSSTTYICYVDIVTCFSMIKENKRKYYSFDIQSVLLN